jgi:hypothetical protein
LRVAQASPFVTRATAARSLLARDAWHCDCDGESAEDDAMQAQSVAWALAGSLLMFGCGSDAGGLGAVSTDASEIVACTGGRCPDDCRPVKIRTALGTSAVVCGGSTEGSAFGDVGHDESPDADGGPPVVAVGASIETHPDAGLETQHAGDQDEHDAGLETQHAGDQDEHDAGVDLDAGSTGREDASDHASDAATEDASDQGGDDAASEHTNDAGTPDGSIAADAASADDASCGTSDMAH